MDPEKAALRIQKFRKDVILFRQVKERERAIISVSDLVMRKYMILGLIQKHILDGGGIARAAANLINSKSEMITEQYQRLRREFFIQPFPIQQIILQRYSELSPDMTRFEHLPLSIRREVEHYCTRSLEKICHDIKHIVDIPAVLDLNRLRNLKREIKPMESFRELGRRDLYDSLKRVENLEKITHRLSTKLDTSLPNSSIEFSRVSLVPQHLRNTLLQQTPNLPLDRTIGAYKYKFGAPSYMNTKSWIHDHLSLTDKQFVADSKTFLLHTEPGQLVSTIQDNVLSKFAIEDGDVDYPDISSDEEIQGGGAAV